ncbi:hypothetical protein [Rhizobium paknamense]|uniref:Uncharacterized protein n=1 Tax=Rhizobium paknamense TaxID=1206817 RepID=A0ABU0IKH3_9HYPH|nr:hypothetical protein [Rhizobium paknamense]MDQ0458123.1 hypothetical protein [Rhizobium paknamense]
MIAAMKAVNRWSGILIGCSTLLVDGFRQTALQIAGMRALLYPRLERLCFVAFIPDKRFFLVRAKGRDQDLAATRQTGTSR